MLVLLLFGVFVIDPPLCMQVCVVPRCRACVQCHGCRAPNVAVQCVVTCSEQRAANAPARARLTHRTWQRDEGRQMQECESRVCVLRTHNKSTGMCLHIAGVYSALPGFPYTARRWNLITMRRTYLLVLTPRTSVVDWNIELAGRNILHTRQLRINIWRYIYITHTLFGPLTNSEKKYIKYLWSGLYK